MSQNQYDNTNTGALFLNDKKGNDKRPDWKGTLDIDGKEYWISGWERTSKSGKALISLKAETKELSDDDKAELRRDYKPRQQQQPPQQPAQRSHGKQPRQHPYDDGADDIQF